MQAIGTAYANKNPTSPCNIKKRGACQTDSIICQVLETVRRSDNSQSNRHLTIAEAAVAYELRCQKRQIEHRRIT
jgi:hypothetical protein